MSAADPVRGAPREGGPDQPPGEPLATVVVVTHRGAAFLPRCLDALAALRDEGPPFQTWVVDNASQDGTAAVLAARDDVRVIRSTSNLGFAGGNNLALREVSTPYAVLVNDDAVPQPGWLAAALAPMRDPGGGRVGAVAPKLLLQPRFAVIRLELDGPGLLGVHGVRRDGEDVTGAVVWEPLLAPGVPAAAGIRWCRPRLDLPVALDDERPVLPRDVLVEVQVSSVAPARLHVGGGDRRLVVDVGVEPHWLQVVVPAGTATRDVVNSSGTVLSPEAYAADRGYGEPDDRAADPAGTGEEVFGGCGAALALRTEALARVGLFDDDFFLYYEDVDLCWRLRRAGWTVRHAPASVVRHRHSASSGRQSDLHLFHDHRNRLLMLTKNASAPLLLRSAGRYPLTTLSVTLRRARGGDVPAGVGLPGLRRRVLASYLRLAPRALRARRTSRGSVPRRQVERWLGR